MDNYSLELDIYRNARAILSSNAFALAEVFGRSFGLNDAVEADPQMFAKHLASIHLQLLTGGLMRTLGGMSTIQQDLVSVHRMHVPVEAALEETGLGKDIRQLKHSYGEAFGSSRTDGIGRMSDAFMTNLTQLKRTSTLREKLTEHWSAVWVGHIKHLASRQHLFMSCQEAMSADLDRKCYTSALQSGIRDAYEYIAYFIERRFSLVDKRLATETAAGFMETVASSRHAVAAGLSPNSDLLFQGVMLYASKHRELCFPISHLLDMLLVHRALLGHHGGGSDITLLEYYSDRYGLYVREQDRPIYKHWVRARTNSVGLD